MGTTSAFKIWVSPGTYSVKAQARCSTDTSAVSVWSSGLSVTISGPAEQPNVIPYQPTGWSDKVVVSNSIRTSVDNIQLYDTDPLFVDWAVINSGTSSASGYSVELYIDGVLKNSWSNCPALKPNSYYSQKDYPIGSLSAGIHTIKLAAGNNGYTKSITILDISTAINLTIPSDNTSFGACSLYSLPAFGWEVGDTFKSYEIQFSPVHDFRSTSARAKTPPPSAVINSNTWKKVLSIPEGTVYWRVVGIHRIGLSPPVRLIPLPCNSAGGWKSKNRGCE